MLPLPQLNVNFKNINGISPLVIQTIDAEYKYIMGLKNVGKLVKDILHEQYIREIPSELDPVMSEYYIERASRIYGNRAEEISVDFEKDKYNRITKVIFKDYVDLEKAIEEFKDKLDNSNDSNEACKELIHKVNDRKFNVMRYINYIGYKAYEVVKKFNVKYYTELYKLDEYDNRLLYATDELYSNIAYIEKEWIALLEYQEKVQNIARELCRKFYQN